MTECEELGRCALLEYKGYYTCQAAGCCLYKEWDERGISAKPPQPVELESPLSG